MALGKRRNSEEESEIDLTPMLDVVFIMLIFFIVTASFVNESGLDVNRPPTTDQPPPPDDPTKRNIVFRISESNELLLDGRRIDIRAVRANVERMSAENPEAKVIIDAHPKSKTELYVLIADQAREAGVYDVSLATDNEK
ncbi:biopolymer transporter ExbD [Porticoccaceae bacterium]|nr:biopolymer transporter ExbD [Porticoccaceae bacterium]